MSASVDESAEARTVRHLRRVMAIFAALLVASTWPLWQPGSSTPQIPWFGWLCRWSPDKSEMALVANLAVFLLLQFIDIKRIWLRRGLYGYFGVTPVPLLLFDQHRMQPWVVQMVGGALLIGLSASSRPTLRNLRAFTLSIYVWSAVSKFDWAFVEGHGQVLLEGLATSIGLSTAMWSEGMRDGLAMTFPMGELLIAVLLALPKTRQIGLWGAIAMHAGLILALGPTGLGHEWGVLIWNAFFIVQIWLLFGNDQRQSLTAAHVRPLASDPAVSEGDTKSGESGATSVSHWRKNVASAATMIACTLPALSLIGRWDWWPSWAVYSSRPAVVQMFVSQDDVDQLPASLRSHVGPPSPLSPWRPVNLDAWSYQTCWCPLYPQERYRLAVIHAIGKRYGTRVRSTVRSTPHRWTGQRTTRELDAVRIERRLAESIVNTRPRRQVP